jgi:hypothetical protein
VWRTERSGAPATPPLRAGAGRCALALLALGLGGLADAASTKGTVILLRALAYDRAFDDHVTGPVDVAVIFRSSAPASVTCMEKELAAQVELSQVKLRGHDIHLAPVDLDTAPQPEPVKDQELWYVCPGLEADLPILVAEAQRLHRITASESRAYVEAGIVLGVEEGPTETVLYVNLPGSKKVGAEFSSQLLGVATVIR